MSTMIGRIAVLASSIAIVCLGACTPEQDGEDAAGLVTEADSMSCGAKATLYTNHTVNPKNLHVRVRNSCVEATDDTMPPPPARLVVLDQQNRPVAGQDISIPGGTTHRGTFTVPSNGSLKLECSVPHARTGCSWFYQYALP